MMSYVFKLAGLVLSASWLLLSAHDVIVRPSVCSVYDAIVESVHDGDTMRVVPLPAQTIRVHGVDAWEVNRVRRTLDITDAEIERGKVARDELRKLVSAAGNRVRIRVIDRDAAYGRIEADVWIGQTNLATWLKENGYERN